MNNKLKNNNNEIKYKYYFLSLLLIVFLINIYLLLKCKDRVTYIILLLGVVTQFCLFFIVIFNKKKLLNFFHNIYSILLILGILFFKNIYLSFLIFMLFITTITREIFNVCLFYPDKIKGTNGTISILVLISIIFLRIFNEKMYNNLLKF
jgi:hypothetical protein